MSNVGQNGEAISSMMTSDKNPGTTLEASISASAAFIVHSISGAVLVIALWVARNLHSADLFSSPSQALFLIWVFECPLVIIVYSHHRRNRERCSYLRAVGRGILGLLVGALVNAFGAISLGAPVGGKYLSKTINWSLAMSSFTVVPAATVFGSSWADWQRLFASTKPVEALDYMICLPAHGAVIGAWFGAWPMPLDWERQWQEWPICVSCGAIGGYLLGMVASIGFVLARATLQHTKTD